MASAHREREPAGVEIGDILAALGRVRAHVIATPFLHSRTLSEMSGCELFVKFENLQFTASFKERGALNKLLLLDEAERARGVIAVSAGNHAQGVAYHAQRLGIPATIVMPRLAPFVKVENTERFGARVVLEGDSFEQARKHMLALAETEGLVIVHPYDDAAVIAGQGTLGLEMLQERPDLDDLVVPIGGGGLIAGVAIAAHHLKPGLRITGVQSERFAGAWHAFYERREPLQLGPTTVADGIAVDTPGQLTLPVVREHVEAITLATEAQIERAIVTLLEIEKSVVEGAGAAGLAAVLEEPARYAGRKVGLVLCGGNIDALTLADVIMRHLVRTRRMARLLIGARDVPGSLARIATILGELGANIEEVIHQRAFADMPVRNVRIDVVVSTRGSEHLARAVQALRSAGFACDIAGGA